MASRRWQNIKLRIKVRVFKKEKLKVLLTVSKSEPGWFLAGFPLKTTPRSMKWNVVVGVIVVGVIVGVVVESLATSKTPPAIAVVTQPLLSQISRIVAISRISSPSLLLSYFGYVSEISPSFAFPLNHLLTYFKWQSPLHSLVPPSHVCLVKFFHTLSFSLSHFLVCNPAVIL